MPEFTTPMPTVERPIALVVEASFDSETYTIDTTTIDGQRVVVLATHDGVRYLTPAETLAVSRALLSRLAYVGFPECVHGARRVAGGSEKCVNCGEVLDDDA